MEEFARCAVCARTPLVGEGVAVMLKGRREAIVCDQCLASPRAASLGEAVRYERIRSAAGAANVMRVYPRPVMPSRGSPAKRAETVA
jgi:hypothetical protein